MDYRANAREFLPFEKVRELTFPNPSITSVTVPTVGSTT